MWNEESTNSSSSSSTTAHSVPSLGMLLKYMLSVDRITMSQHLEERSKVDFKHSFYNLIILSLPYFSSW